MTANYGTIDRLGRFEIGSTLFLLFFYVCMCMCYVLCVSITENFEGLAQDSNIFLKLLFRGNFDSFVNNANLGAIAHTSNGT